MKRKLGWNWLWNYTFRIFNACGGTPIDRATVQVLAMNAADVLLIRVELLQEGALFT
jgi:hypothetical protein